MSVHRERALQRWADDRAWREAITRRTTRERLTWRHGPERAEVILAGHDPSTNADVAAWNALGKSERGAA